MIVVKIAYLIKFAKMYVKMNARIHLRALEDGLCK